LAEVQISGGDRSANKCGVVVKKSGLGQTELALDDDDVCVTVQLGSDERPDL
jgi:hypothetical protein